MQQQDIFNFKSYHRLKHINIGTWYYEKNFEILF
jgi:hypothetical protein